MENPNQRYLFIGGLHRSGTSLLRRALQAHSGIGAFRDTPAPEDEGQHLQTIFPTAAVYGGPGRFCFAREACLTETSHFVTPENREKLLREWGRYWDKDKTILMEKSPPNLIRMRFLQAMFPNSLFLIIIRHPLAGSYATQKWSNTDILELMDHWMVAHQRMLEDLPFIRQWRIIRYEDFAGNPQAALTEIYQWIGMEPAPLRVRVEPDMNRRYFAQWETEAAKRPALAERLHSLQALPNQFGYYFTPPYSQACPPPSQQAARRIRIFSDAAPSAPITGINWARNGV